MPTEYLYPVIPSAYQLWPKYTPLKGITSKGAARKIVEQLFRDALHKKVSKYTGPVPPTVHGHRTCKPKLCYGSDSTVERIGQWYVMCAEQSCGRKYATWLEPAGILQYDLFYTEPLRSLLFIREELKPVATKDSTRATTTKNSIERSAYYRSAFSCVYPDLAGQVMEKPDTDRLPNPYPTPPGPSQASTSEAPQNGHKRALPAADNSPMRATKRARNNTSTVIDLCSSDDEVNEIPFHVILWTANNTDPTTFVLRTSGRLVFSLLEVEHHFAVRGLPRRNSTDLQVYNPVTSTWTSLAWKAAFGRISKGQTVLMRGISVSEMVDFKWMKAMASAR